MNSPLAADAAAAEKYGFKLLSSVEVPSLQSSFDTYIHEASGLRVAFSPVQGPLCCATIIITTEANNNKGLPHTLEHLVFMGSERYPFKGFLDNLANKSFANGTNAYTATDHTAYSVNTAGSKGLLMILPVFLDHIFNPTLTDASFVTEIYHIDENGKDQGVVYCEMQGRENTEADLQDYYMRQALFSGTGYAAETGGITHDIATLTNDEIRAFHRKMYQTHNASVLIQGVVDVGDVLKSIVGSGVLKKSASEKHICFTQPLPPFTESVSLTRQFPSSDEKTGSITYGWRGPALHDIYNCLALTVLFTYLQEHAASPLSQRFVERENPLASSIDFNTNEFKQLSIELIFNGVELKKNGDDASDESDESEDESDESDNESGSEDSENEEDEDDDDEDLFAPDVFKNKLYKVFNNIKEKGFAEKGIIKKTVSRLRVKYLESLEDSPFDTVSELTVPDLMYYHNLKQLVETGELQNFEVGSRLKLLPLYDDLEQKDDSFWIDLLDKWIISAPVTELKMVPSIQKSKELSEAAEKRVDENKRRLGEEGLKKCGEILKNALAEHAREIPGHVFDELINKSAHIPSVIPTLHKKTTVIDTVPALNFPTQFTFVNTQFNHIRLCFHTQHVPDHLRPYLVVFQELILATDLKVIRESTKNENNNGDKKQNGKKGKKKGKQQKKKQSPFQFEHIPYTEVVKAFTDETVSLFVSLGFGNSTFGCSSLSDIFYIYGCAEQSKYHLLCKWITYIMLNTVFPEKRILTTVSNLLTSVTEELRDGYNVCDGIATIKTQPANSNNTAISIFKQRNFLKSLKADLKSKDQKKIGKIINDLEELRAILVSDPLRTYMQISAPLAKWDENGEYQQQLLDGFATQWIQVKTMRDKYAALTNNKNTTTKPTTATTTTTTAAVATAASKQNVSPPAKKSKAGLVVSDELQLESAATTPTSTPIVPMAITSVAPQRNVFFTSKVELPVVSTETRDDVIIVPISGVESSFTYMIVPCDVSKHDDEFYSLMVLTEMLSRTEGPLYHEIRGKGYAYDASCSYAMYWRQLSFTLYETSSPVEATLIFYNILLRIDAERAKSNTDPSKLLNEFNMETTKSSLIYKHHSARCTAPLVISEDFKSVMQGFRNREDEDIEGKLAKVTIQDLYSVFDKYLVQFLPTISATSATNATSTTTAAVSIDGSVNNRAFVITTSPGNLKAITEAFANSESPLLKAARVQVKSVDDFML